MERPEPSSNRQRETALNRCYRTLAGGRRWAIVGMLDRRGDASGEELTTEIETGSVLSGSTARTRVSLLHKHLPMLAQLGAFEGDGEPVRTNDPRMATLADTVANAHAQTTPIVGTPR